MLIYFPILRSGPLWTHSSFGYENKNGHIKHFIHNITEVVKQLLFNLDDHLTLQQLHSSLEVHETEEVLDFLSHTCRRANMLQLDSHLYAVGKLQSKSLMEDEAVALELELGTKVKVFTRLFRGGVMYHSTTYHKSEGKRNSTMCSFATSGGDPAFGQIYLFVADPFVCPGTTMQSN